MKPIYYSIVVFFFITAIGFGQENEYEKFLAGGWVFEFDKSFSELDHDSKKYLDSISTDQLQFIKNNYNNRRLVFEANGNYKQIQGDGQVIKGFWKYDPNGQTVQITLPNGAIFYQDVLMVDKNTVLLSPKTEGNIHVIINRWYFTRF